MNMSTNSRVCFVWRNKGEDLPEAFAQQIIGKYPSWSGLVFQQDGEILMASEPKVAKIEGIKRILDGNKDKSIGLVFGLESGEVNAKNLQPFPVISSGTGDDEIHKVVCVVDGPFEQYGTNPDPTGRPYLFAHTYLMPKFQAIWKMVGEDAQKFIEAIQQKYCHDEILAAGGPGTCVAVITQAANNGMTVFMHPDCNSDEFSWGFTNDCLQYSEDNESTEAAASAASAPKGNSGKPTLSLSGDGPTPTPPPAKDKAGGTYFQGQIPNDVTKNNEKKPLYAKFHGSEMPGGWKNTGVNRPWVSILKHMVEEARQTGWNLREVPIIAGTEPIKQPTVLPTGNPNTADAVLGDVAKEKTLKFIQAIDSNTLRVMTPEEMSKLEKERPSFFDQFGCKLEDVIRWNRATIEDFCKSYPTTSVPYLMMDLMHIVYNLQNELEEATAPAATPAVVPAATPATAPASPPAAPPQKRFSMG